MKFLAIFAIASLAFAAGWVMRGKKQEVEDFEPMNNKEDQSDSMFL